MSKREEDIPKHTDDDNQDDGCPCCSGDDPDCVCDCHGDEERFQKGKVEYRSVQVHASLLDTEEGQPCMKVLDGRAIVFDTPTPLYEDYDGTQYYEQIHHDALAGVDVSNVVLKYNHSEHVPPLSSTKAGTLDLKVDDQGVGITARMANTTQASDIHELVRTGHLDKMSFAFTVANDAYDSKTKTRTIFKFDKIYDVSIVDFPAYEQTSVSARSYVLAQQEFLRKEQKAAETREQEARAQEQKAQEEQTRDLEQQLKKLVLKTFL